MWIAFAAACMIVAIIYTARAWHGLTETLSKLSLFCHGRVCAALREAGAGEAEKLTPLRGGRLHKTSRPALR